MDTHPVFDWKMSALGTMPVLHLMPCMLGKFPSRIIVDDVIDGTDRPTETAAERHAYG